MLHDSNVLSCFFLPIIFIILLAIMMYIHKRQLFKYIYFGNVLCLITAVVCYMFIDRHPVGQPYSASWMEAIPFVWLFTIFGGYFCFIASTKYVGKSVAWLCNLMFCAAHTLVIIHVLWRYLGVERNALNLPLA